ncbi:acetyl-CoA carboxylase [Loigolactobacillus zhaoyuanensis]|uniref:Acetyl-CoA carboxylase n=1 Tax=Loigolactobacillus zhaoyuanensis TaxID=2486017 RepID=A0ABW8UGC6_9LACO|nr:acetyl-CoA carboxylase [Loigolactobacillus zhaoyuanensis]
MIETTQQAAKLIQQRIQRYFKPQTRQRYQIDVVNNIYGPTYNFFLNIQVPQQRERSLPLHRLQVYQLNYLENVITLLQNTTQLTFNFIDFKQLRWPDKQTLIRLGALK